MRKQTQDAKKVNTVEVMTPSDTDHGASLPSLMPKSPLDLPVEIFTQALERRELNRKALLKWIESNLQHGVDFGQIHIVGKDKCQHAKNGRQQDCSNKYHWSKPSLWKPGAEKICGMMGIIPRFPNLDEYEKAVLRGEDIKVIILKCELHTPSGFVAAEGTGARKVDQDRGDINKSMKMAEKSAHIDATLRLAGLSEIFTQDIEDMVKDKDNKNEIQPPVSDANHTPPSNEEDGGNGDDGNGNNSGYNASKRITAKQHKFIMNLSLERGVSKSELNDQCLKAFGVAVDYLSRADASTVIENLLNQ